MADTPERPGRPDIPARPARSTPGGEPESARAAPVAPDAAYVAQLEATIAHLRAELAERARAEAVQRRYARLLRTRRALLDLAPAAILVREMDGTITFWSDGAARLYGWSQEEALGRTSHELLATRAAIPLDDLLERLVREGKWEGELVHTTRSGSRITVLSRWALETDEAGLPRAALEINTDITERQAGELARAHLAAIVASSDDAIFGLDFDGAIRSWNGGAARLFGYAADDVVGRSIGLLVPPERAGEPQTNLALIARGDPVVAYETVRLHKDGHRIDVAITLSPVWDGGGQLLGAAMIVRDIGERRRAEAERDRLLREARAAEDRYHDLLEAAPDAVVTVDRDGRIALVNAETERLFGYAREELLGQPVELLVPERARGLHPAHRAGYVADPHNRAMGVGLELTGRRKDGGTFPVEISLSPLRSDGALLVTAAIRDVTERAVAERLLRETAAELARSNEELEHFAYVASHDLQEPLRMVASYTQLLARRYRGKLDDDADEFIGFAVDGAQRMQRLIRDLLAYSRVGRGGAATGPVDLAAMVDGVAADLAAALEETGGAIERGPLPTVPGDATQLRQLIQNLIGNALKYRRPDTPPVVRIDAVREGDHWHLAVRDNGIGIAPEHAERVFGLFQRLHTQEEYAGTGLGLAICRKIVERHGGRIWIESAPGDGSTFHVTLPAIAADAAG